MDYTDIPITIVLRGDELEQLDACIRETGFDNEGRLSLLCYLKQQIEEQLPDRTMDQTDVD